MSNAFPDWAVESLLAAHEELQESIGIFDARLHRHVFVNEALARLFRRSRDELLACSIFDLLPEDQRAESRARLERRLEEGGKDRVEIQILAGDGQTIDIEIGIKRVAPDDTRYLYIAHDITERKRAEERLPQWAKFFETAEWGVVITNPAKGTLTLMNRAYAKMHGYTVEELKDRPIVDMYPPEVHGDLKELIRLAHERGHHTIETLNVRKDGTVFPVMVALMAIKDDAGEVVYRAVSVHDLSERQRAEAELHDMRQGLENALDGICRLDEDGRYVTVNLAYAKILGYEQAELIGREVTEVIHADDHELVRSALARVRDHGKGETEVRATRKSGSPLAMHLLFVAAKDQKAKFTGHYVFARDISDRKNMEARLLVADRMASLGTLAGGVAHEINNPLAYVSGNLEHIREQVVTLQGARDSASILTALDHAEHGVFRIREIVRDMKTFSRSDDERRGAVNVHDVLELAIKMVWNEIRHRAKLSREFNPVPAVMANESRLGQVFVNLLMNAAHAIVEGRAEDNEIVIRTTASTARIVAIEISDTGSGIPEDVKSRVFDPFFTTKTVGSATGLGLAICHGIIRSLGGDITFDSQVGRGSTFRIVLPASRVEARRASTSHPPPMPPSQRRGRVLIIDDEPLVAETLALALLREHDVETARSGDEALRRLSTDSSFDVIFCDLMMPQMTGMDLYAKLRGSSPEIASRMVFLTGGAFTPGARAFVESGTRTVLEKPIRAEDLRAHVRQRMQAK